MFEKVNDPKAVDNTIPPMSAEAMNSVRRGIILGVIRSLGIYLFNTVGDQHKAGKKMLTFINAMRSAKDITEYDANWQYDTYFSDLRRSMFAGDPDCCAPCCSSAYLSWYSCIANLIDDTHAFAFAFTTEGRKRLTDHEKTILDNLNEAQNLYYKARDEFEKYFREVNKTVLKEILVKYGTTLSQIAPDWYKDIKNSAGLEQPTEQESPLREG